jgi:ribosome-binding protein aMBF1 (putative translation factor)
MQSHKPCVVYADAPKPKPKPKPTVTLNFGEQPKKQVQKHKNPDDDDNEKIKTVKHDVAAKISSDRLMLGWKQQDLAQKAGLQLAVVNNYEKGTSVHVQGEYQKIRKALDAGLREKEKDKEKK